MHNKLQDLNQLHVEQATKDKTLQYVMQHHQTKNRYPKPILAGVSIALFALFAILFPFMNKTSVNEVMAYISFDVNPSLEFQLDKDYKVIDVQAFNNDAKVILDHMQIKGKGLKQAITTLLKNPEYKNYLNDGILEIGVFSKTKDEKKLEELVKTYVSSNLNEERYHCARIDEKTQKAAHRHQITSGKYRVIEQIQAYDTSVPLETLSNMSMKELYAMLEKYDPSLIPQNCRNIGSDSLNQNQNKQHKHQHGK